MKKIVISEFMDTNVVDKLGKEFDVNYDPNFADRFDDLCKALDGADALIVRNRTQVRQELLDAAPALLCVGRLGVGLDNIDQKACASRGIEIFPAVGANNLSVAEYVITSAMILLRKAYLAEDRMISGEWPRQQCSGRELAGSTLGLVGFGGIAQLTARMASSLGVDVIAFDPFLPSNHEAWANVGRRELMDLLAEADIVSIHTPLIDETRHLISADAIASMKKDAVLINAARGGVVDESALVSALRSGHLGGTALDVFEDEPLREPDARKFRDLENVLLTPHIAGVTAQSNTRVSFMIAEKIASHLNASV